MRNPIIRNTALFLMTSAMEDHQRKLAKEIETKKLEEEKAKNEQIYGWQLGGSTSTGEPDLVSQILKEFSVGVKPAH
ncbi:MAG: hypothetical protein VXW41_08285 [SAR324 cluster bacterium]|nr:hypothetical protein [SAR324 cluster bacterium]